MNSQEIPHQPPSWKGVNGIGFPGESLVTETDILIHAVVFSINTTATNQMDKSTGHQKDEGIFFCHIGWIAGISINYVGCYSVESINLKWIISVKHNTKLSNIVR